MGRCNGYIKLQEHEKRKTRAYKEDIENHYNMTYQVFKDEHYYVCHDGRELRHIQTEKNFRTTLHRHMKFIDVRTAADANTSRNFFINMIMKKMPLKIRS